MSRPQHISLLKFQQIVKSKIEQALPLPCWITAEISELKVNYSGHCYMELVEKGGDNSIPKAKASAVIWRTNFGMLSSYFRSETGSDIAEGMNVLVKVSVLYHELYGMSLVISDIDPAYTIGDMERQRRQTVERLMQEGVFDMNRGVDLPSLINRIALVSSRNAAGYQDFMDEIGKSGYNFSITLFDAFMQGHSAEDSIISALEKIAGSHWNFDAVVIIRGGGAQSDLAVFDSYRLCNHISQFMLPVITGIGHDKDESIADMVAAVSLKTPTAVAGWLIEGLAQFETWLETMNDAVRTYARHYTESQNTLLVQAANKLSGTLSALTREIEGRLYGYSAKIMLFRKSGLLRAESRVDTFDRAIRNMTDQYLSTWKSQLNTDWDQLKTRAERVLKEEQKHVENLKRVVEMRRPENILGLGFSVVRKDGKVVKDTGSLEPGNNVEIILWKGSAAAEIKNTRHDKE